MIDNISSQVSSISQSPKTEVFDDMGNVIPTAGRTLSSIDRAEKQSSSLTGELGGGGAYQQTKKGQSLPWLDWLLNQGDKVIIKEFDDSPIE